MARMSVASKLRLNSSGPEGVGTGGGDVLTKLPVPGMMCASFARGCESTPTIGAGGEGTGPAITFPAAVLPAPAINAFGGCCGSSPGSVEQALNVIIVIREASINFVWMGIIRSVRKIAPRESSVTTCLRASLLGCGRVAPTTLPRTFRRRRRLSLRRGRRLHYKAW